MIPSHFLVGIYIRLSREDEKEKESSSVESQRSYLKDYIEKKGYQLIKEYTDDGYTGTNFQRPGFQELLNDIKTKKINMILVKDLSRLGRNNSQVSFYLDEYFPLYNIRFVAIDNDYDSFIQNASKEYAWLTNGINETYCLDISKKVRSALKIRKEKGLFTGWKAPYGYQKDPKNPHKLIIDPKASKIVKQIFFLAYQGNRPNKIATILSNKHILPPSSYANPSKKETLTSHLWSSKTIQDILTNETYLGNLTQGKRKKINYKLKKEIRIPKEDWIVVPNTHQPIIDHDLFWFIQERLKKSTPYPKKEKKLLSDFLFCKECQHKISIIQSKDKKRFYCNCSYYKKYSKLHACTPHTLNYQTLENNILNIIQNLFQQIDFSSIKLDSSIIQKQRKKIEKELLTANAILDQAYMDQTTKKIDSNQYQRITSKINSEINHLNSVKEDLKNKEKNSKQHLSDFLKLKHPNNTLLYYLIDKILINEKKEIEIYFKFSNDILIKNS